MAEKKKHIEHDVSEPSAVEQMGALDEESATTVEQCEELLANKDHEIKTLQDRVLRLAAEMENARKRLEREKADGINFGNESLMRELIPVVDNLERAIQHGENEASFETLLEGVRMTLKSFLDTLTRFGCTPFESMGKPFDPNYHEAVMQVEAADQPDKTVLQELQKGYTLRDRLLRPALVTVSKTVKH